MKFKLSHKIQIVFDNLKIYDAHLIDSFQFLGSSLEILCKNIGKNNFKNFSQEFDSKVLHLVKQKGFFPMEIWAIFKSLK